MSAVEPMSGDPNSARDDVLGALSLIEATITGMPDCPDKLRLAFASSALRRANEKMRADVPALAENVIPIGHSVRVPCDPADAYPAGSYKHPDAGRIA